MTRDELATAARKMREDATWQFESSVECAALEVTEIAKQISKALGDVSIVEAKQAIVREFITRLDLSLTDTITALAPEDEGRSYLWERCYACGHRLAYASDGCPQCGIHFKDGDDPQNWPEKCQCDRCTEARRDGH